MDFASVLDHIVRHLELDRRRWALAGGLAMQAYGLVRGTQDLDLVTEATAREGILAFLSSLGYELLHASAGFSNHVHAETAFGRVDMIYVDTSTADSLFGACRAIAWTGGRTVRVPSPEHLVAMKVHAMKNDHARSLAEMADIQFLMALPDVDRSHVRRYFESAGLLERYDEILRFL